MGQALFGWRRYAEVRSDRADDGEASRKAGSGMRTHLTHSRSKKGRNYFVSTLLQFFGLTDWLGKPRWSDRRGRFGPGEVAAGVVGGAVGTAAAIATAPFGGFDNGYRDGYYGQTYAQRNGFVCQPGTWFKGEDGRRHICQ